MHTLNYKDVINNKHPLLFTREMQSIMFYSQNGSHLEGKLKTLHSTESYFSGNTTHRSDKVTMPVLSHDLEGSDEPSKQFSSTMAVSNVHPNSQLDKHLFMSIIVDGMSMKSS